MVSLHEPSTLDDSLVRRPVSSAIGRTSFTTRSSVRPVNAELTRGRLRCMRWPARALSSQCNPGSPLAVCRQPPQRLWCDRTAGRFTNQPGSRFSTESPDPATRINGTSASLAPSHAYLVRPTIVGGAAGRTPIPQAAQPITIIPATATDAAAIGRRRSMADRRLATAYAAAASRAITMTPRNTADSTGRRNTLTVEVVDGGDEGLVCEDKRCS